MSSRNPRNPRKIKVKKESEANSTKKKKKDYSL